jgi:cAMP phosphodiesterase
MNPVSRLLSVLLLFCINISVAQEVPASFKVIPLGVLGGSDESNLSSYMIAPEGSDHFVCLDAGTLHAGIERAIRNHCFSGTAASILRTNVKGYLISHPHLDHVSGLIINSPDDTSKNIYALPFCIEVLKEKYFTWKSWANFANEGDSPSLGKYHYVVLDTAKETALANTGMFVRPFFLSHGNPYLSTAFLIRCKEAYLLYLGDTGSDQIEHKDNLFLLWQQVAPLIRTKKLKAIFIETSFSDEQPVGQLFGHLSPSLLMKEMDALSQLTGKENLQDFPVVITHIKPVKPESRSIIKKELMESNPLKLKLVFAEQANALQF